MAIAWANPKAASVSMNIDLVQSVAHILVRECFQAKIDALLEVAAKGVAAGHECEYGRPIVYIDDLNSRVDALQIELAKHEAAGIASKRTFERSAGLKEDG